VIAIWIIVGELLATRTDVLASRIDQLVDDAHTDYLTGLGNRRGLSSALHGLVLNDIVILLDLDHFKRINDTRGHAAGDQVIRDFADTMRSVLRSSDGAFRYGGEELVAILRPGDGSPAAAVSFLERLSRKWGVADRPTFSAGVCMHGGTSSSETLDRADAALYEAKRAGRGCWRIAEVSSSASK
jgi:diguanylate cyclase (GGDEF)-like protein